jgi:hypothetical protein
MLARALIFGVALLLIAASCGENEGGGTNEEMRTIRVNALDELAFDPSSIEVEVGATVREKRRKQRSRSSSVVSSCTDVTWPATTTVAW